MSDVLIIASAVVGATLPILVTQLSKDAELRSMGRLVMKLTIAPPLVLVVLAVGFVYFFNGITL